MKGIRQLVEAINSVWLIDELYGMHLSAIAYLIMQGEKELSGEIFELSDESPYVLTVGVEGSPNEKHNVSVIPVNGPMARNDQFCGPIGSVSMTEYFKEADNNPDISAHVIRMFTPGGEAAGIEGFADAVANAKKPVVVSAERMLSGGYYVAAGADMIVMDGKNAQAGSIGAQVSYFSREEQLKQMGINEITIKANTSPDKNSYNLSNPSEEDKARFAAEQLDPLDKHFMDHVKAHRIGVNEDALTGKVYYAEAAIRLGLADEIGTFDDAVNLALSMVPQPTTATSPKTKVNNSMSTEANQAVTIQEELATAQQQVLDLQTKGAELDSQIETLTTANTEHLQTIAAQAKEITELKAQVETLSAMPATDPEAETAAPASDAGTASLENIPADVRAALERGQQRRLRNQSKNQ